METNSSQKDLANGLNALTADKKVWIKPTVEMISQDKIASGTNHLNHEGAGQSIYWNFFYAS